MSNQLYGYRFSALGSKNEIQIESADREEARAIVQSALSEVDRVERKFSRYRDDSVITSINRNAGLSAVEVDSETMALLRYAGTCWEQSEGAFDITSGVLRRVWNFQFARVPTQLELETVLPLIGWDKVELTDSTIMLNERGMEVDLGGIGKEYCVDRVASLLVENGVGRALVNLGGDVRGIGSRPDGSPWQVGVVHPRKPDIVLTVASLLDQSICTSGDYERYFELNGARYCHILNPRTGYPTNSFQAVTVISNSCLVSGTLTTITMLSETAKGLAELKECGLAFIAVTGDGEVVSNFSPKFEHGQRIECEWLKAEDFAESKPSLG